MPGPDAGWTAVRLGSIDSTSSWVRREREALRDRTVVTAREQTGGRGRLGRRWHSPPGGLYASLLWKPAPPMALAPRVSLMVADVLAEIMGEQGIPALVKWPNDVVAEGCKLAGLLAESGTHPDDWLILGVGVNLEGIELEPEGRGLPPCWWSRWGIPPAPEELLERLLSGIDACWPDRERDPLENRLESLERRLWLAGRDVAVVSPAGGTVTEGVLDGLEPDGRLRLSTASGPVLVDGGEIDAFRYYLRGTDEDTR
jgi:BirA family biotin operon repressor/biotin-[acetyl-CoA-carboxylase] ligase